MRTRGPLPCVPLRGHPPGASFRGRPSLARIALLAFVAAAVVGDSCCAVLVPVAPPGSSCSQKSASTTFVIRNQLPAPKPDHLRRCVSGFVIRAQPVAVGTCLLWRFLEHCPVSGFGIVLTTVHFHKQTADRLGIAVSGALTIRHCPLDLIEKTGSISGLYIEATDNPFFGRCRCLGWPPTWRRGRCVGDARSTSRIASLAHPCNPGALRIVHEIAELSIETSHLNRRTVAERAI